MNPLNPLSSRLRIGALALGAGLVLAACGGSDTASNGRATSAPVASEVLPVTDNPIDNPATAPGLSIDSVLVENNVDPATGNDAADHLEIALTNTSTSELSGFEVFTTYTDAVDDLSESYYLALPSTFTIAPGATRVVHFDDTGATDHFPDNPYSLYHTSVNGLEVTVEVSATGVAVQTATVQKDPGGAENPDE